MCESVFYLVLLMNVYLKSTAASVMSIKIIIFIELKICVVSGVMIWSKMEHFKVLDVVTYFSCEVLLSSSKLR